MNEYLTELAQDASDFSYEAAKGAHSVLLPRMGDGVVEWGNLNEVKKIRTRYAETNSAQSLPDKNRSLKVVSCIEFNKSTCNRQSDHDWINMFLKHMCPQHYFTQNYRVEIDAKRDC